VRVVTTSLGVVMAVGAFAIIFTRTPGTPSFTRGASYEPARSMTEVNEQYAAVCRKHFAGDAAGAQRAFDELGFGPDASAVPVGTFCDQLLFNRDLCRSEPRTGEEATRCAELERTFGGFPPRAGAAPNEP
jgi:hypothetical protein